MANMYDIVIVGGGPAGILLHCMPQEPGFMRL